MHDYLLPLEKQFKHHADKTVALKAKAYLLDQFEHYGLTASFRRNISKEYFKKNPLVDIKEITTITQACFQNPYREFHHAGIDFFAFNKKFWNEDTIQVIEYGLLHQSWWDSVDAIASDWIHPYFIKFPKQIRSVTKKWNQSKDLWLQRSSILFQKFRKKDTDTKLLSEYILNCANSKEFFIQKGIGWALREYSKTDPAWVSHFVKHHSLPALSKREALKIIHKKAGI